MIDKAHAESYGVEIISRTRSACRKLDALRLDDFISDAPKNLAQALTNAFHYLERVVVQILRDIDWETNDEVEIRQDLANLQVADNAVKFFAAHIRYVDSARTEKLPWEIIPSFEKLVQQLHPNAQIMLRPMWHYNYATTVANFRDWYLKRLKVFESILPAVDVESNVLHPISPSFHIISFPTLERENVLLHSLIGHEVGHLVAARFVTEERIRAFMADVKPAVEVATDKALQQQGITRDLGPLIYNQYRNSRIADNVTLAAFFWYRAVEEILSDVVGAMLFGPAALFATFEMAVQFGYDERPSRENDFYPPWRLRLRHVHATVSRAFTRVLDANGVALLAPDGAGASRLRSYLKTIVDTAADTADRNVIGQLTYATIAYAKIDSAIAEALDEVGGTIERFRAREDQLAEFVPRLVDRLNHQIPPNALEEPVRQKARGARVHVGLVDIINAAWVHKITSPDELFVGSELNPNMEAIRNTRNKLTLKAVEFALLAKEYARANRGAKSQVPTNGDPDRVLHEGVLTAPELEAFMARRTLSERLVVTPLLDIDQTIRDAAIDVRLGTEFIIFKKQTMPTLDISDTAQLLSGVERYQQKYIRRKGEPIVLHPRQLVIGSTLEYVQVPSGLMCYVIGKSTWGRTGLVIATATKVDPGFKGCITLEMINEGEVPLVLFPGVPIAQLVFHKTEADTVYEGVYSCPVGPEFPRFAPIINSASFWLPEAIRKSSDAGKSPRLNVRKSVKRRTSRNTPD